MNVSLADDVTQLPRPPPGLALADVASRDDDVAAVTDDVEVGCSGEANNIGVG